MQRAIRADRPPLSHAQQRMWFLHQLEPNSVAYHLLFVRRIRGELQVEALRRALEEVVHRHAPLRTVFPSPGGEPYQHVLPPSRWELGVEDRSALDDETRAREVERIVDEEASRPFDLATELPLRTRLLRLSAGEHVLFVTMNHIASDGSSMGVFWLELSALYARHCATGERPQLPLITFDYVDYAEWQRNRMQGEELERQLGFWRERLHGAPEETALPSKWPRPVVTSGRSRELTVELDAELSSGIRALARRQRATLFMTLLAALRGLLARYTGQADLVIGTPVVNRPRSELEGLIGLFVNTLVLRNDVRGEESFSALMTREKRLALTAYEHQETPFELIVDALGVERNLSRSPLFQVLYAHRTLEQVSELGPGLTVESCPGKTIAKFDITMTSVDKVGCIEVSWIYNEDLFEGWLIEQMARDYRELLRQVVQDPGQPLAYIQLVRDEDRRRLGDELHAARTASATDPMPALLEAQVVRTPDAIAVVFEGETLTYRELDARANRLAHHLVAQGASADEPIGVLLERSCDLVVALLAVWKAGAAYLPLDPHHPRDRLRQILEDSRARLIVTESRLAELVPAGTTEVAIDRDRDAISIRPATRPAARIAAEQLAYVIYTSGSTGRPKGVGVEHRSLASFVASMQRAPGITPTDTLVAVTTVSFDISGLELWLPLCVGAKVVVCT
ncbi:MAG: AMP-binding protein, partial [Deltaproteobacteria bacterium]|nr:AMP-binding protein [Deltaproteobacteria bacterium]